MNSRERRIINAAVRWWERKKPVAWSREQHLAEPLVNTATKIEMSLADVVADYLRNKKGE